MLEACGWKVKESAGMLEMNVDIFIGKIHDMCIICTKFAGLNEFL